MLRMQHTAPRPTYRVINSLTRTRTMHMLRHDIARQLRYMHDYFPLAASTAKAMKANASDSGDRFIYTTHAWLMQRFLDCPCPQPPPTSPCTAGLPGVWTAADGRSRFYFSKPRDSHNEGLSVKCLTSDFQATPAGSCTWNSGTCKQCLCLIWGKIRACCWISNSSAKRRGVHNHQLWKPANLSMRCYASHYVL